MKSGFWPIFQLYKLHGKDREEDIKSKPSISNNIYIDQAFLLLTHSL